MRWYGGNVYQTHMQAKAIMVWLVLISEYIALPLMIKIGDWMMVRDFRRHVRRAHAPR